MVTIVLAGGVVLFVLVLLPWMIASSRKAQHAARVRQLSLLALVLSTLGFIWGMLAARHYGPLILILSIVPGAVLWLITLIWACLGRPAQIIRGFEVQPLTAPDHRQKT